LAGLKSYRHFSFGPAERNSFVAIKRLFWAANITSVFALKRLQAPDSIAGWGMGGMEYEREEGTGGKEREGKGENTEKNRSILVLLFSPLRTMGIVGDTINGCQ